MKKLVGVLVCLLTLALCSGALADVAIDETNFPDEHFREYIIEEKFDTNTDGILSSSELSQVDSISCTGKQIENMDGIAYFTAITYLDCRNNELLSLDVSANTALTDLFCSNNPLTILDVSKNIALKSLDCGGSILMSLDVSKNTALTSLDCGVSQLTSLDVSKNTALTELLCWHNQLTNLDVSKNTNLAVLWCQENQLTGLDVSNCAAIVDTIKNGIREDKDDHWEYGADSYGRPLVSVDKTVKVNLENVEPTEPTEDTDDTNPTTVTSVTVSGVKYKLSGNTATATGPEKKTAKTITIQSTVNANGKTYKVTEIKASAFKKMSKLTKVTIGKNVKSIGKNAFYGCKKLKTIKINSKLLTEEKTGKNAFKGIYKKATITCPKGKAKTYKKWLTKKAGVPKTAKIK